MIIEQVAKLSLSFTEKYINMKAILNWRLDSPYIHDSVLSFFEEAVSDGLTQFRMELWEQEEREKERQEKKEYERLKAKFGGKGNDD